MSNQQIEQQNISTNQNVFPQMENFNMNTHNLDLDIIQQKQMIDNLFVIPQSEQESAPNVETEVVE